MPENELNQTPAAEKIALNGVIDRRSLIKMRAIRRNLARFGATWAEPQALSVLLRGRADE